MTVVVARDDLRERQFGYRLDFAISSRRNAAFGRWASEMLGYSGETSTLYANKIVDLLNEPPRGSLTVDDNTVSQVLVDLINAGAAIPPDELRAILLEFEEQARRDTVTAPQDFDR